MLAGADRAAGNALAARAGVALAARVAVVARVAGVGVGAAQLDVTSVCRARVLVVAQAGLADAAAALARVAAGASVAVVASNRALAAGRASRFRLAKVLCARVAVVALLRRALASAAAAAVCGGAQEAVVARGCVGRDAVLAVAGLQVAAGGLAAVGRAAQLGGPGLALAGAAQVADRARVVVLARHAVGLGVGAAQGQVAAVFGARVLVVAGQGRAGDAGARLAGVVGRAGRAVGVAAGAVERHVLATAVVTFSAVARILGAAVLVVAAALVGLAVAVVVQAVAGLGLRGGRVAVAQAGGRAGARASAGAQDLPLGALDLDRTCRVQPLAGRGLAALAHPIRSARLVRGAHALLAAGALGARHGLARVTLWAVGRNLARHSAELPELALVGAHRVGQAHRLAVLAAGAWVAQVAIVGHAEVADVAGRAGQRSAQVAAGALAAARPGTGAALGDAGVIDTKPGFAIAIFAAGAAGTAGAVGGDVVVAHAVQAGRAGVGVLAVLWVQVAVELQAGVAGALASALGVVAAARGAEQSKAAQGKQNVALQRGRHRGAPTGAQPGSVDDGGGSCAADGARVGCGRQWRRATA